MPEYKQPVTPVKVNYTCDTCGVGAMHYDPPEVRDMLLRSKETYRHKCSNPDCNQLQQLERVYPHIRYE